MRSLATSAAPLADVLHYLDEFDVSEGDVVQLHVVVVESERNHFFGDDDASRLPCSAEEFFLIALSFHEINSKR